MARNIRRPLAIITGANGGMGRACARLLGATRDLVLTDASARLSEFVGELEMEGFTVVAAPVGDLGSSEVLDALAHQSEQRGGFDVLIHAAGLGPASPWRSIVAINHVASAKLLDRLTPHVRSGGAAVLVASVAGHMLPPTPEIAAVLTVPGSARLCDDLEPLLLELAGPAGERALGTLAYCLSKRKVMDLCAEYAAPWGAAGARIVSISPGMIYTPMGRHEAALDPLSETMVTATPAGRWGTASEIAMLAQFLVSPAAAFITGSDVKIDGGALASAQLASPEEWLEGLRQRLSG
jgi:NAD(P)-dependent dehydrogenase (short-subunit alcohol dehydrogenase family)